MARREVTLFDACAHDKLERALSKCTEAAVMPVDVMGGEQLAALLGLASEDFSEDAGDGVRLRQVDGAVERMELRV